MKTRSIRSYYSKMFYKDKLILSATSLTILATFILIIRKLISFRSMAMIQERLYIQTAFLQYVPVIMAGMMLISYEYSSLSKRKNLAECVSAIENGYQRNIAYTFYTLLKLVVVVFALFTALLIYTFREFVFNHPDFLQYLLKSQFIYYFLLPLVSVLIGIVASFTRNRLTAYLLILLFFITNLDFGRRLMISYTGFLGSWRDHVIGMFNLWPKGLSFSPLNAYGYSAENYLIIQLLFWVTFFLAFVFLSVWRKRKTVINTVLSTLCIALTILFFFIHISPASVVNMSDGINSGGFDEMFYWGKPQREKTTSLEISSYDLSFDIGRQLKADVIMTYSNPNSEPFYLTLYHGFLVSDIQNEAGQSLNFQQDIDIIEVLDVLPESGKLRIIYQGSAHKYFSNDQGIYLPASFAYYPRPGMNAIFDIDHGGFKPLISLNDIAFDLAIKYKGKVYSNLPEVAENNFSGSARGISLFAGMYEEELIDDVRVIYPYLDINRLPENDFSLNVKPLLESEPMFAETKLVIFIPGMNHPSPYESFIVLPDHLMLRNGLEIDYGLESWRILSGKRNLLTTLIIREDSLESFQYRYNTMVAQIEELPEFEEMFKEDIYYRLGVIFEHASISEEEIIKTCHSYINDNSDTRSEDEFLTWLESKYLNEES